MARLPADMLNNRRSALYSHLVEKAIFSSKLIDEAFHEILAEKGIKERLWHSVKRRLKYQES